MLLEGDPATRLERFKYLVEVGEYPDVGSVVAALSDRQLGPSRRAQAIKDYRAAQADRAVRAKREARRIPAAVRRDVLASGNCAYCGDEATCVDHIVPVSQGGTRRRRNLAPACRSCNENKLDFTVDEWIRYRAEKNLPWPPLPRTVMLLEDTLRRYREDPEFAAWVDAKYAACAAPQVGSNEPRTYRAFTPGN
ncbi:HNH endonuclease [Pseudonocardia sediminis]|uniref:HNH endonuclease n=1 Tax=Pseudonocardia sediminis TaxID=1397368 RepID=UPI001029F79C